MLSLPEAVRARLASEFRIAASQMAAQDDPSMKAYFFSVFYGETQRVLNWHWSAELSLLNNVIQTANTIIKGRIDAARAGDPVVGIPEGFEAAWDAIADDLATLFEADGDIDLTDLYLVLARAAELSYSVTGNGYYLYLKGDITIGDQATEPAQPSSQSPEGAQE